MGKRGVVLIFSYMVIAVLAILSSAFMVSSVSENSIVRKYSDSAHAFWVAEAGLAKAYQNWLTGTPQSSGAVNFGSGTYSIDVTSLPEVTVTGTFNARTRIVQALFVRVPNAFDNTLSVGRNLTLAGLLAKIEVYDKTRISGAFSKSAFTTSWFADKQEGASQANTTIPIPDYNGNGTANEFTDFVAFGRKAVASYPPSEVVYIQTSGTVNIFPSQALIGKKVIFVEGANSSQGNVNIFFDATWANNQDLTVISTGSINYIEPLQFQANSRLSTASYSDYGEASIFRSEHESVIYSNQDAHFIDILDWGSTTGNVIANRDVSLAEILTYEKYFYSNRAKNGNLPPGFQWLSSSTGTPYMRSWQEAS